MKFLWVILVLAIVGCSSSPLRVESFPDGADVLVLVPGMAPRKVGVTPLSIDEAQLGVPKGTFQIQVSKDGFLNESILVPPTSLGHITQISIKLKEPLAGKAGSCAQLETDLPQIARGTAEVQQFIAAKKLDQAEMSLRLLISKYPSIPIFHVLLGNVFYLKRDLDSALASYRRSQDIGGGNQDAARMIRKIEDFRGIRLPAASGAQQ